MSVRQGKIKDTDKLISDKISFATQMIVFVVVNFQICLYSKQCQIKTSLRAKKSSYRRHKDET